MLLFLLLAVSAEDPGCLCEVRQLPDGQTLIMRTLDWDSVMAPRARYRALAAAGRRQPALRL
jgi:hypothetical protein